MQFLGEFALATIGLFVLLLAFACVAGIIDGGSLKIMQHDPSQPKPKRVRMDKQAREYHDLLYAISGKLPKSDDDR